jgi:ribonuclease Z
VRRNVSSIAVQREADLFLFDCGEGTQRQMMRFGVGFAVRAIFVSHMHADHYLGITGLLRTMTLQDRQEPLAIWGPPGSGATIGALVELGGNRVGFPLHIGELGPGEEERFDGYAIRVFGTRHTSTSVGFCLAEDERLGRFDVERARALGVPEGPSFGRLHRGEPVELPDGRVVPWSIEAPDLRLAGSARLGDGSYAGTMSVADGTVRLPVQELGLEGIDESVKNAFEQVKSVKG